MGCKAEVPAEALQMCTGILLCRGKFRDRYDELQQLKENPESSTHIRDFFDITFRFRKYMTHRDEWHSKQQQIDFLKILRTYKRNHEVEDYTSKVLFKVGKRVRPGLDRRIFCATVAL